MQKSRAPDVVLCDGLFTVYCSAFVEIKIKECFDLAICKSFINETTNTD